MSEGAEDENEPCGACKGTGKQRHEVPNEEWEETLVSSTTIFVKHMIQLAQILNSNVSRLGEQKRIYPMARYELTALRELLQSLGF